jgi:hypothetical protein
MEGVREKEETVEGRAGGVSPTPEKREREKRGKEKERKGRRTGDKERKDE